MLFISKNLKSLRKGKNMTQEEVAEALRVSAQSVSKWERGDTFPDITLLPALANLYKTSIDNIIGMDKINDTQARNAIFMKVHEYMRNGDNHNATDILLEALKTFPNDEGLMSDLAIVLALDNDPVKLNQAVSLCERVLSGHQSEKVHHTTRAALSFIYLKLADKEKAIGVARNLPHMRESREVILAEFNKEPSIDDINAYLRFIGFGEYDEQDIIVVDFGINMINAIIDGNLRGKLEILRNEVGGYKKLPTVRIRDNFSLAPNQIRVRYYLDYLLDKFFDDEANVITEIIEVLRKIAEKR